MSDEPVDWLRTQLDEDERVAPELAPAPAPAESADGFGNGTYEIGGEVQPINTSRPNPSGRMTLHESLELIRERYGDAIRQLGEQ